MNTISAAVLKELLLGASKWVIDHREELNRINRFPVADADTGTNLSATLYAVYALLKERDFSSVAHLLKEVAREAFYNARGNSGIILSQYLSALSRYIKKEYVEIRELALSLKRAYQDVLQSLENPVEGTIITVMREVGEEAERAWNSGLKDFLGKVLARAHSSLERTREMLPVLKREGVVDSGAKGFVLFLEGMKLALERRLDLNKIDFRLETVTRHKEDGIFCTVALIRTGTTQEEISAGVSHLGNSLAVSRFQDMVKVHIHTADVETFRNTLEKIGEIISLTYEPIREEERNPRRKVGVVVDSALDIPPEMARELGIEVVPVGVVVEGKTLRDEEEISREMVLSKLLKREEVSSSLPLPVDFLRAFSKLSGNHETILAFHISRTVSGTLSLAKNLAGRFPASRITVVDTHGFSLGGGLKVLYAVELLDRGLSPQEVVKRVSRLETLSFVFAEDLSYGVKGGRVKPWKAKLQKYLGLGIIMGFSSQKGGLYFKGAAPGSNLSVKLLKGMLGRNLREGTYDVGIAYTRYDSRVKEVEEFLRRKVRIRRFVKGMTSPAIMVHAGPSAFGVFALKLPPESVDKAGI